MSTPSHLPLTLRTHNGLPTCGRPAPGRHVHNVGDSGPSVQVVLLALWSRSAGQQHCRHGFKG